jgi:long-chain acyl-CoA synthetase
MVVGDGRKFVGALIVPNVGRVRAWAAAAERIDLPADDDALCENARVRDRIQRDVDRINESFESHEKIKQFRLVAEEFTEDNGLLTPTMKKKRHDILDRYEDRVTDIYDDQTASDADVTPAE